ncbi:hypothetical protein [Enterobacter ludwigii]|uniref:hypothetical protein n=1 Tax=Enterobacter ludwigii TaxID=299767 RepID=UPI00123BEDE1|nr:hypothetical protein [Enterobacter ludwigii]
MPPETGVPEAVFPSPIPNPPTTSNRPAVASVTDVCNVAVAPLPKPTFYRLPWASLADNFT